MKKLLFSVMAFVFATTLFAQKKVTDVAKFSTDTYDFGKVKQNTPPTATFVVTNVSKEPLIIEAANPTCGCTISDYTKAPIAPGQTGVIHATYNAATLGGIHKTLTVKFAGVDEIKQINLAGEVLEPAAYDTWVSTQKTSGNGEKTSLVKVKDDGAKSKTVTKTDAATTKSKVKKGKKVVEKSTVKS
jgi:hypothetical protein